MSTRIDGTVSPHQWEMLQIYNAADQPFYLTGRPALTAVALWRKGFFRITAVCEKTGKKSYAITLDGQAYLERRARA